VSDRDLIVVNGIRALRQARNLTQEGLARELGVTRVTVNYLERGAYLPSLELALKISRFFGRPVESVFIVKEIP
jgi:putative transcriptional regulator